MATHDYVLANQSGSSFRSDLNNALAAIVSQNSSATEPATTYSYQYWIDTSATPALVKQRNAANDAWITLAEVNGQTLIADGDNAKPGLAFASDTNTGIRRESENEMSFVTGGNRRVTISSSGALGIGTSSPSARIDVSGDTPKIRLTDIDTTLSDEETSSAIEFYQSDDSGAGVGASIAAAGDGSTGNLALEFSTGNDDLRFKIFANGTARFLPLAGTGNRALFVAASGSLTTSSSDASMKTNVTTLGSQLEVVKQLNPVSYNWIDTEERGDQLEIGFIAQELQPLVPEVIGANSDETLTVDYSKLTAVLTKGLQEALTKIETLETKVAALEAAN
jgi:hypothetical protein